VSGLKPVPLELVNDLVGIAANQIDHFDGLLSSTETMVDRYKQGRFGVHVAITVDRGIDTELQHYVAVYERAVIRDDLYVGGRDCPAVDRDSLVVVGSPSAGGVHVAVPMLPSEFMEKHESFVSSIVRLYILEPIPVLLGQLFHPALCTKGVGAREDWELDRVGLEWRVSVGEGRILAEREACDLIGEVIERGHGMIEVTPDQPSHLIEPFGLFFLTHSAPVLCIPPLMVVIGRNFVRTKLIGPPHRGFKGLTVAIRPAQASPDIRKEWRGVDQPTYLRYERDAKEREDPRDAEGQDDPGADTRRGLA
jgi:hypothetical protein